MSHRNIVDRLKDLGKRACGIAINLQRRISNQNVSDARVLTFYNLAQAIRFPKISFLLLDECLPDMQSWVDTYIQKWGQEWPVGVVRGSNATVVFNDHELLTKDFKAVMLIGYTQALFSLIDSKFRLFTVALDSNACNNGTDSFFRISGWLLGEIGKTQYEDFLKFFSYVRNTIHNNGLYKNKDFPHVSVPYSGTTYNFDYGQPFTHPNVQGLLYLEITPDVINMMEEIILHP